MSLTSMASIEVERDDAALVVASKKGNQDAFALLVQRHQHRIFNLVFRILQQYDEANEVTQETFLAAWQGLPSFRGEAQFSTWLHRLVVNTCRDVAERQRTRVHDPLPEELGADGDR